MAWWEFQLLIQLLGPVSKIAESNLESSIYSNIDSIKSTFVKTI
jgi:hypothetical protein